jgi:hypothetical protein
MEKIDIAAHRPHPPGYLAYIAVARAINAVVQDVNASLVLWNIAATVLATLVLMRLAWESAEGAPRRTMYAVGVGALMASSPLSWFYGEVAEIYVSEMLAAVTVVYLAWRVTQHRPRAIYWSAVCLPLAAAFKLSTAVFLVPLVAYAWGWAPARARVRAAALLAVCTLAVGAMFLSAAPDLGELIWGQFASSSSGSRLDLREGADPLERLNHNLRDTLTGGVAMLGVVNLLALVYWAVRDRRLPVGVRRSLALLWLIPWLFVCVAVHIAKPGYLLPLLPLSSLILAAFYTRQRAAVAVGLLIAQGALNVAHFAAFGPLPPTLTGGTRPYRAKTLLQRFASDLQPLTVPTAATIRRSDQSVMRLLAAVGERCPSGRPVVIAATEPVDARRAMWYLPDAVVIYTAGPSVQGIAVDGQLTPVLAESRLVSTDCQVIWLAPDTSVPEFPMPPAARREPGVGFVFDASVIRVTPNSLAFQNAPGAKE